jgi:vancomycin permeability regulator SanA
MKKVLKLITVVLMSWFLIHIVVIVVDGLNDENYKSDVGVILGNKVNPDGSLSERLIARLDKGLQMYQDSLFDLIIVSGGFGKEGHYEGTKMFEYLVEKGVAKNRIIVDDFGNTTQATAKNVRKMKLNITSVTVISQYHHISRTKLAFKNEGFNTVYGGHANYFEVRDFYSITREFFGYYKYLFKI